MGPGATIAQLIAQIALVAVPILAAIIFHEVAHGAVAYALGDPTAARHGRLTLNPLPHIDPVGTLLVPGILLLLPLVVGGPSVIFGWARPVPVDVRRLRHPRRDSVLVAMAGPGTNLLLAALSAVVLSMLPPHPGPSGLAYGIGQMALASLTINCVLAVFNLLPIPPLDGGRVLTAFLPARAAGAMRMIEAVGMAILLVVVLNTNVVRTLVQPVMGFFLALVR